MRTSNQHDAAGEFAIPPFYARHAVGKLLSLRSPQRLC